jgi:FMN phosphatase YigB (HAD superfamily)
MSRPIATFDVWDTLLRRRCDPEAVKLFTGHVLASRHGARLAPAFRDRWALLALRRRIELDLVREGRARGSDGAYLAADVFARLVAAAGFDGHAQERSAVAAWLVDVERAQERFVTYADPSIGVTIARHDGHDLAFISDFHLPAEDIAALLRANGLERIATRGLSSGEHGLAKKSGRLFAHAQRTWQLDPATWTHVGDDPQADVRAAERLGITAVLHRDPGAEMTRRTVEQEFGRTRRRLRHTHRHAIETVLAHSRADDADGQARAAGAAMAPLFAGFALWTLERALADRSEAIWFFAREGYFFAKVFEAVAAVYADVLPAPPVRIAEVSRQSTFAASLETFDRDAVARVWSIYKSPSLAGLLHTLGVAEADCDAAMLSRFGLVADERLDDPAADPRIAALIADPAFRRLAARAIAAARDGLRRHLAASGLTDPCPARVTTVDIGWRGSIQSNLARLYPDTAFQGLYLGLERRPPDAANVSKAAYVVDLALGTRHADLVTYVAPMEFLCGARVGSVEGYGDDAAGTPRRRPLDAMTLAAFDRVVAPFQDGVVAAARIWAGETRTHALAASDLLALALPAWRDLVRKPPPALWQGFSDATIDETFGLGRTFRPSRSLGTLPGGFAETGSIGGYIQDAARAMPWPHAFARHAGEPAVARFVVPMMLRLARRTKRTLDRLAG